MSEVERQVVFSSEKKNKGKDDTSSSQIPQFFENAILEYYVRAVPLQRHSHSQQLWLWASLFSFFFVRVAWEKVVKNNCDCGIALTQSTIVAVSYSEQLWLWAFPFSSFCQGHVVKDSEKTKKKSE